MVLRRAVKGGQQLDVLLEALVVQVDPAVALRRLEPLAELRRNKPSVVGERVAAFVVARRLARGRARAAKSALLVVDHAVVDHPVARLARLDAEHARARRAAAQGGARHGDGRHGGPRAAHAHGLALEHLARDRRDGAMPPIWTNATRRLFWRNPETGERVLNGEVTRDDGIRIHTHPGHLFDAFRGDEHLTTFTVSEEREQGFELKVTEL